jgi:carboxylesterase type B
LLAFYESQLARAATGSPSSRTTQADLWAAVQTDAFMRLPARRVADAHCGHGGQTYVAEFAWGAHGTEWDRGAFHAIDLPFTFGTLDRCGWAGFLGADAVAARIAAEHMAAWASFARSGDPGTPELESWPRYELPGRPTMRFMSDSAVVWDPLGEIAAAWAASTAGAGSSPTS